MLKGLEERMSNNSLTTEKLQAKLQLKNAVKNAADIHEKSWSKKINDYTINIHEAAKKTGHPSWCLIYVLLSTSWNDALHWAENDLEGNER